MQIIDEQVLRQYLSQKGMISAYRVFYHGLGIERTSNDYLIDLLGIPLSLSFALDALFAEQPDCGDDALDSLSLFSLFKGLYLPLSGMTTERVAQRFGIRHGESTVSHRELVQNFFVKSLGLTMREKIAFLLGDPFLGESAWIGQDTLLTVLTGIRLIGVEQLRDRLARIADIGVLFIEGVDKIQSDPAITSREALIILQTLPEVGTNRKKDVLRDLFLRAGRLERYFLARLLLRRLNFGYEYRSALISEALATHYNVAEKIVNNAIALSDIFHVAEILETEGQSGLRKLVLKPLNPVKPALAGIAPVDKNTRFPLWIECKYDGIRLMAHKDTNLCGKVTYAAFTRRRHDWLSIVNGLEDSLAYIPASSFIVDGELHGSITDWESQGERQATVYEVYRYLQGHTEVMMQLKYIIFDILYLNGQDVTELPLNRRRAMLEQLLSPLHGWRLPLPIEISQGATVNNLQEFRKWYHYFCTQGHEGAIAKVIDSVYALGQRSEDWRKKKVELYLDLVLNAAFWATGQRGPQVFSAYGLACREENDWRDIGRTEGLSQENNYEIIQRVAMESLLTGRAVQARTGSAIRQGIAILPAIVVTVRFEDVVKDNDGVYSLRDPKIVHIRPRGDSAPEDADSYETIRQLYMKKRLG